MFPIHFPPAHLGFSSELTIEKLERDLDVAVCLIKRLADRVRGAAGSEALEPELTHFLDVCDPVAQGAVILHLNALVQEKKQTEALRLLRELFGATWDQAFDLYAGWSYCTHAQKLRSLQAGELHKLAAAFTASQQV